MRITEAIKVLWSHTRDIHVEVRKHTIKYSIPTYTERLTGELGEFIRADKRDGFIDVIYGRREPPAERIQCATVNPVSRQADDRYWTND